MPFRKDKQHQRRSNPPLKKNKPPLKLEVPSKDPTSPSTQSVRKTQLSLCLPVLQKSILRWGGCFTFERTCPCKKLTKHACAGLSSASFVSCVSCSELGDAPYSWPLHCSLPCPNPHPLHKHRLPPRVLDSRTVSLPAGGTLVSSQSLMAAASIYLHPERR